MQCVLIHGLGQNSSSWDKTISCFTKDIKIDCPDLSSLLAEKEIVYNNLYAAFKDYCNNIPEPLCLCGLSLGGILALNYTIDNPKKVKSLILIGTQYKMPKVLLKFQNIIFHIMPKSAFKDIGFSKHDFIGLTNSMINLDFSTKLTGVLCDTMVLCGKNDKANMNAAKGLAQNISGAKLKIIENASHEVNIENPEKLASEIELSFH